MAAQTNMSYPSICIPRVFSNITWQRVKEVFEELNLGMVDRVDMPKKKNDKGEEFKRCFVHFKKWYNNEDAKAVREMLLDGEMVPIEYDQFAKGQKIRTATIEKKDGSTVEIEVTGYFWKCYKSNVAKPEFKKTEKRSTTRKPKSPPKIVRETKAVKTVDTSEADELRAKLAEMQAQMAALQTQMAETTTTADVVEPTTPTEWADMVDDDVPTTPPYSPRKETPGAPMKMKLKTKSYSKAAGGAAASAQ